MQSFLNFLFKPKESVDFAALINEGAVVLDVRTIEEYKQGHLKNSLNIPLDALERQLNKLNKDQTIITVCQSGMRSRSAASFLKNQGFTVYNGGSWFNLK